jgi:hypothetical protein
MPGKDYRQVGDSIKLDLRKMPMLPSTLMNGIKAVEGDA